MSNPRASIQRAVTGPPTVTSANGGTASVVAAGRPAVDGAPAKAPARQIGKAHGRMRCVNLCLSTTAAEQLRRLAKHRDLTLGEALTEVVSGAVVPTRPLRNGRQPTQRRRVPTANVYVLLTETEATDLCARATNAGRTISDYTDLAISATQPATQPAPLTRDS